MRSPSPNIGGDAPIGITADEWRMLRNGAGASGGRGCRRSSRGGREAPEAAVEAAVAAEAAAEARRGSARGTAAARDPSRRRRPHADAINFAARAPPIVARLDLGGRREPAPVAALAARVDGAVREERLARPSRRQQQHAADQHVGPLRLHPRGVSGAGPGAPRAVAHLRRLRAHRGHLCRVDAPHRPFRTREAGVRARRPPPAAGRARSIPRADANLAADADGGGARGRQGSRHDQRGARRVARGGAAAARRAAARRSAPPRVCARLRRGSALDDGPRELHCDERCAAGGLARCGRPRSTSRRSPRCTSAGRRTARAFAGRLPRRRRPSPPGRPCAAAARARSRRGSAWRGGTARRALARGARSCGAAAHSSRGGACTAA